jgi:hypothetical protein
LVDIKHYTKDLKTIACVASTIYHLKKVDKCQNYYLTWWVLKLSGHANHYGLDYQQKLASSAVKKYYYDFDYTHYCPKYKYH